MFSGEAKDGIKTRTEPFLNPSLRMLCETADRNTFASDSFAGEYG